MTGIRCPKCGYDLSTVLDTRKVKDAKKRRRRCFKCEHIFWTAEIEISRLAPLEDA